jgi:multidrug efflux pump subunit AcrA (membrane-fusion protein)
MTKFEAKAYQKIYRANYKSKVKYWFIGTIAALLLLLFLPWTQNIKAKGNITTLFQEDRPQQINTPIPGKIVKWYVKEGDFVKAGDTILILSEIKAEYLDPNLIQRTKQQVDAKEDNISYYENKIGTASQQIRALAEARSLKLQQLNNKLKQLNSKLLGEQAELEAAENEYTLAKDQYERQQKMYDEGLVSQTQLQQRNLSMQNANAKRITVANKIAQTEQEVINTRIEQNSVEQDYTEKISKIEGDRFQNMSQIATSQGDIAKLENQVANYTIRNGMYILQAPQDGQIVQARSAGIGEIVKEDELIARIVPDKVSYAVEMFVRPIDMPLISIGQKVRFMFDGFPAIIFSGWPDGSYGTFGGKIVAYENTISNNGLFRVLVEEDPKDRKWPKQLKIGSGAQAIALLKDVPIWYELWRNINGFPPDYYKLSDYEKGDIKSK